MPLYLVDVCYTIEGLRGSTPASHRLVEAQSDEEAKIFALETLTKEHPGWEWHVLNVNPTIRKTSI